MVLSILTCIHLLPYILFTKYYCLKSSSFWLVWAQKKKWTALHFGSLYCPFISCFQNKCTSSGCLNKINNSLAALIVFLRMHWRLIFGNVRRCSTLRLRVGHFIYSKYLQLCYFIYVFKGSVLVELTFPVTRCEVHNTKLLSNRNNSKTVRVNFAFPVYF